MHLYGKTFPADGAMLSITVHHAGRNAKENEVFDYTSTLAHFRKNSSAITTGKTMQFIPKDGLYIYFRYDSKQTVMVVTNTGDKDVKPDWSRMQKEQKDLPREEMWFQEKSNH